MLTLRVRNPAIAFTRRSIPPGPPNPHGRPVLSPAEESVDVSTHRDGDRAGNLLEPQNGGWTVHGVSREAQSRLTCATRGNSTLLPVSLQTRPHAEPKLAARVLPLSHGDRGVSGARGAPHRLHSPRLEEETSCVRNQLSLWPPGIVTVPSAQGKGLPVPAGTGPRQYFHNRSSSS